MAHHLLAPIVALLLIVGALLAVFLGFKKLQLGGLLGRLFGEQDPSNPEKKIEIANSIDPQRIDSKGNLIPIGTPDSKGDTQVQVVPIDDTGLFSDPGKVIFTPPGGMKQVEVTLPDGVTAKDVSHVIVITPEVTVVTVKDSSGISASTIDDLLVRYQR